MYVCARSSPVGGLLTYLTGILVSEGSRPRTTRSSRQSSPLHSIARQADCRPRRRLAPILHILQEFSSGVSASSSSGKYANEDIFGLLLPGIVWPKNDNFHLFT